MALMTEKSSLQESLREKTLTAAKQHKSSWIALGQYLFTIYKDKHYRDWGFTNFEGYCMKELGIRQTTAAKLLRSYNFLEKEEPRIARAHLTEDAEPAKLPNYESVNLLRLAKENQNFTPRDIAEIRESVIDEAREPKEVRAQVKKLLSEREDKDPKEVRRDRRNTMIKRVITTLQSSQRQFESENLLPGSILKKLRELADELERHLE